MAKKVISGDTAVWKPGKGSSVRHQPKPVSGRAKKGPPVPKNVYQKNGTL